MKNEILKILEDCGWKESLSYEGTFFHDSEEDSNILFILERLREYGVLYFNKNTTFGAIKSLDPTIQLNDCVFHGSLPRGEYSISLPDSWF